MVWCQTFHNPRQQQYIHFFHLFPLECIFKDEFNEKISPLLVYEQGKTKLYLGFDNFRVITKYNRSSKYALAVHQLALEISKRFDD